MYFSSFRAKFCSRNEKCKNAKAKTKASIKLLVNAKSHFLPYNLSFKIKLVYHVVFMRLSVKYHKLLQTHFY